MGSASSSKRTPYCITLGSRRTVLAITGSDSASVLALEFLRCRRRRPWQAQLYRLTCEKALKL
jgi:hypothetical protein